MKRLLLFVLSLFTLFSGYAASDTWEKVTTAPETWEGDYLIVYEKGSVAFDGSLQSLDAANNTKPVTITGNKIETTDCDFYFTIAAIEGGYSVKSNSGYYIGNSSDENKLKTDKCYINTLEIEKDGIGIISAKTHLRYNSTKNNYRFRYFKSSTYTQQQAIQLYKRVSAVP